MSKSELHRVDVTHPKLVAEIEARALEKAIGAGISLRDYFAAAALSGLVARSNPPPEHEVYARTAYYYADAMLAARKGGQS